MNSESEPHLRTPQLCSWPAALALGVTLLFSTIVTSPVVLVAGTVLVIAALSGWIREVVHDNEA